jgi:hypothetical protein
MAASVPTEKVLNRRVGHAAADRAWSQGEKHAKLFSNSKDAGAHCRCVVSVCVCAPYVCSLVFGVFLVPPNITAVMICRLKVGEGGTSTGNFFR